jgi:uncharacterized protein YbdZ (MbtH family)
MNRRKQRFFKLVRREADGRHEVWPAYAASEAGYEETGTTGRQEQMQTEAARRNRRGCRLRLFGRRWW